MSYSAPLTEKICSVENCGKKITARGFCCACYYRFLRRGDIKAKTQTKRWKHRLSEINPETKTAICAECGPTKIVNRNSEKTRWRCSTESNERSKHYKRSYRQSKKDMLKDYCEICDTKENLCWDHCHKTDKFRGTLCSQCNFGIGSFKDSPEILEKAILYLKTFLKENNE